MSYVKSITTDFSGVAPIEHQLHAEIKAENGITTVLQGISRSGDTVTIIFNSALSGAEESLLNTIISSHVPDNSKPKIQFMKIQPQNIQIPFQSYALVTRFKYGGSAVLGEIDYINVMARMTDGATSYDLRVIRHSDMLMLAEKTGINNTESETQDMGLINNVPLGSDILEIYAKLVGGTENDYIHFDEIVVYYGN